MQPASTIDSTHETTDMTTGLTLANLTPDNWKNTNQGCFDSQVMHRDALSGLGNLHSIATCLDNYSYRRVLTEFDNHPTGSGLIEANVAFYALWRQIFIPRLRAKARYVVTTALKVGLPGLGNPLFKNRKQCSSDYAIRLFNTVPPDVTL